MLRQLGAAGLLLALWPAGPWATPEAVQQAIRQRIGDREPQPGGMTLTLPKIAETGNSVPLTVAVDSPMTPGDHVLAHPCLRARQSRTGGVDLSSGGTGREGPDQHPDPPGTHADGVGTGGDERWLGAL